MDSIIGVNAVRVSRLKLDGTPDFGNDVGGFLVCGGISKFQHDFQIEKGSSIFARDAAGNPCVNRKRQDDVAYATFTLTMCRDDPRLSEIILHGGADLLTDANGYPVGRGIRPSANCGSGNQPHGVCIELWSELLDCDAPAEPNPYLRSVLPRAFLVPAGYTREDGLSLPVYNGFVQPNANLGNGPFDDFDLTEDVGDFCYFDFGDDGLPTCHSPLDYVELPAS